MSGDQRKEAKEGRFGGTLFIVLLSQFLFYFIHGDKFNFPSG
jgi:hypothetical protein